MGVVCRPKLKWVRSPIVDEIGRWTPDHDGDVYLFAELDIGPEDDDTSDIFRVLICTPEGLRSNWGSSSVVIADRALLVVEKFSWPDVKAHLESIVAKCVGYSWEECTQKLQRHFVWEYEDYK